MLGTMQENPIFDINALPIVMEDEAWVAANVIIAPGVTIDRGTVMGSLSSVFTSFPK